jgi:hypothetical protein
MGAHLECNMDMHRLCLEDSVAFLKTDLVFTASATPSRDVGQPHVHLEVIDN